MGRAVGLPFEGLGLVTGQRCFGWTNHPMTLFSSCFCARFRSNVRMPRRIRVQYPGALYHMEGRGDRREAILRTDGA